MKRYFVFVLAMYLFACHSGKPKDNVVSTTQSAFKAKHAANKQSDHNSDASDKEYSPEDAVLPYYIVVADTGTNYYALRDKMVEIHRTLNIPVDTMGRSYNKAKDLIALPDNDPDEIYAGDYFPRRYATENLSLEYLNFYHPLSPEKTIALLSGIYEKKSSADSALAVLRSKAGNAFVIKADIYQGCIH